MEKSTFETDVAQESVIIDFLYNHIFPEYYYSHGGCSLKVERDILNQLKGIDLEFVKTSNDARLHEILYDAKAQMKQYIGKPTKTFSFELSYLKNDNVHEGWFLSKSKLTTDYILIWIHDADVIYNNKICQWKIYIDI